jgi:phosphoribosylamine--glycine ligase
LGDPIIHIPSETETTVTFHAGTAQVEDTSHSLVTSGGRVLCVVGLADSIRSARDLAYEAVHEIHFEGMQYRTDIGFRALERKSSA